MMLKIRRFFAIAFLAFAALQSTAPTWAATPLEALFEGSAAKFILGETAEGSKIGDFVLNRPVRSQADLDAFLTRLDREQFKSLARDLETRVRQIDAEMPAEGSIPEEARAALLRDAAGKSLSFNVNPRGEVEFIDLHTAHGSLRESTQAFLHPDVDVTLERFNGRMLKVHRVPIELTDADERVNLRQLFGPGESVVLGVSEKGDFSLVEGDRRYEGNIVGPPRVTDNAQGVRLAKGLMLRFNDLPPESLAKLRAAISPEGQSITLSCVNGVCIKLGKAGIRLGGPAELPIYRTSAIQRMIEQGFQDAAGKAVRYDIFMNSDKTVEDFFKRMKSKDVANQRLLKMAQSKYEFTEASLMKQLGLADAPMDGETRSTFLALIQKGVPTLIAIAVPVIAAEKAQNE
jgi:hypothetical protein